MALLDNVKGIKEVVDSEKAMVAVVIPQNFARHLAQGENTPVQLIADGRNSSTAGIAMGYCSNIISENIAALLAIAGITLPGAGWLFYNRSV